MNAGARWRSDRPVRPLDSESLAMLWDEVEAEITKPTVLVLVADRAELGLVVGLPDGAVLTYRPSDYDATGTGSLTSSGDPSVKGEPPVVAYYFDHHTEFARSAVVARTDALRAAADFCNQPTTPPPTLRWKRD